MSSRVENDMRSPLSLSPWRLSVEGVGPDFRPEGSAPISPTLAGSPNNAQPQHPAREGKEGSKREMDGS